MGGSEDFMAIGIDEWTPVLEVELAERRETCHILHEDRLRQSKARYPKPS
jgi:hypothetical protein